MLASSIDTLYISYQALALDAFRKIVVRPQLGSSVAHLLHTGCVPCNSPGNRPISKLFVEVDTLSFAKLRELNSYWDHHTIVYE